MQISRFTSAFGFHPLQFFRAIGGSFRYLKDYLKFKKSLAQNNSIFKLGSLYPCFHDWHDAGGQASGHYFHQDLFVASRIFENNPQRHIDVGSRVDGFVAHVASFRKISIIDIREMQTKTQNIEYFRADMMNTLPDYLIESTDSLSCLHAIEHFGLGRYGDPIYWDGHLKGFSNLEKMLKSKGRLYFSTPIGDQRIEFNAHRVFSIEYLLNMFYGQFDLYKFSFVDDKGDLHEDVLLDGEAIKNNCGCFYGCGIFELIKK